MRRNYKALWEQLKAVVLYGKQQRFKREELFSLMLEMETKHIVQTTIEGVSKSRG